VDLSQGPHENLKISFTEVPKFGEKCRFFRKISNFFCKKAVKKPVAKKPMATLGYDLLLALAVVASSF